MILVNVVIHSNADDIQAVRSAIATMEEHSRAEAGCHDYTFSVELNNPEVLRVTERWENMEALSAHFQSPHMAAFQKAMAEHPPSDMQVRVFDANEVQAPAR